MSDEGVRRRTPAPGPDAWDPDLPYGGKVYLARKKKPDSWFVFAMEVLLLAGTALLVYYAYYYFDDMHFRVTHTYARLGYPSAQHQIGQKFLYGKGVEKNDSVAMQWFRQASDQGHPHAAYNLAIGHLKGMETGLEKGAAAPLLAHAASKGVKEAHRMVNEVCTRGGCDT